jgi:hypothetical protein
MLMGMSMKGSGLMIKPMDMGDIITAMALPIKEIGKKINKKAMERRHGQTDQNIKGNT